MGRRPWGVDWGWDDQGRVSWLRQVVLDLSEFLLTPFIFRKIREGIIWHTCLDYISLQNSFIWALSWLVDLSCVPQGHSLYPPQLEENFILSRNNGSRRTPVPAMQARICSLILLKLKKGFLLRSMKGTCQKKFLTPHQQLS